MDLGLKGKKAILAGASRGIGRATARVLAAEGCDVAICARGQEGVDKVVAELKASGARATGAAVDIGDAAAYAGWINAAAAELGGCDIFVCFSSAGGGPASEDTWKATFTLDLLATSRGIEAALPHLEKSSSGAIVAISSTAALEDFFGAQAYNAMKAAVIAYAAAQSQALAPKGIRVNTVSPGPIFVDDGPWAMIKQHMAPLYEGTLKNIPMGRMGNAEEVARAIAFAASPACGFMTGANIVIDGGLTKRIQY
ncbi:MAG: SDR family oxidoreductase [Alphaproteobacteria bacterium]|nr:SDR family oxidoreductase [Alphaproteobacteria bacterium]